MDPIAHTLLGAALARTKLGRDRPLAMPTLVLASNAPDLDVAAYFWSSDAALAFRRGLTHGPLGLAILPLLVTWVVWVAGRRWRIDASDGSELSERGPAGRASFGALLGLAYLAMLTHPALDWLNTYGVRFLHPFDRRWFYGDTLFIVDPWVWLVLGAGVVLQPAQRSRRTRASPPGWVTLAVIASALLLTAADSMWGQVLWLCGIGAVAAFNIAGRPVTERARRHVASACVGALAIYIAVSIGARGRREGHRAQERRRADRAPDGRSATAHSGAPRSGGADRDRDPLRAIPLARVAALRVGRLVEASLAIESDRGRGAARSLDPWLRRLGAVSLGRDRRSSRLLGGPPHGRALHARARREVRECDGEGAEEDGRTSSATRERRLTA